MKLTDKELTAAVESAAKYLREKDMRERLSERPTPDSLKNHPDRGACFHDFDGFISELKSVEHDLDAAVQRLEKLHAHFAFGRMQPFDASGPRIVTALGNVRDALAQIQIIERETALEHPAKTRKLTLQESAVRLAFSVHESADSRRVRATAQRIMLEAGLAEPTHVTISRWIRVLRHASADTNEQ